MNIPFVYVGNDVHMIYFGKMNFIYINRWHKFRVEVFDLSCKQINNAVKTYMPVADP